jgi:hypothetical protein
MAWLNGERSNGNGQEEAPVEPQPQSKPVIVPMPPKAPLPPVQTKHGTTVADVLNVLRELGLADQVGTYEQYLEKKYGHGLRNLDADQVREQFVNLSRCKRDKAMLKQLLDYFALLENFKKAA